jgi:hypothetical protein
VTDPTIVQQAAPVHTGDPVAVILARMEVKLDQALTEQGRHASILDRHDHTLDLHGNRITAAETTVADLPRRIQVLEDRKAVSPATMYAALTLLAVAIGALAAIVGALNH